MQNMWLVIIPPILVLFLSFITHRIALSLLSGILSATLIFHNGSLYQAIVTAAQRFIETIGQSSNLFIFIFLIILGILIILINQTGGSRAYANYAQQKIETSEGAETASFFLSFFYSGVDKLLYPI